MARAFRRAAAVSVAALTLTGLAACAAGAPTEDEETSITLAVTSLSTNWDPFNGAWAEGLGPTSSVYDPLLDAEGGLHPRLATEWTISDDGKTVEFTLRDDVTFVDGTHMDAEGMATYLNALFTSEGYFDYGGVSGDYLVTFEATGEYALQMNRAIAVKSDDGFLGMNGIVIASPATVGDPAAFEDGPVGSGPYVIDEVVTDSSVTLVRNPDYWEPERYPYDKVTFLRFDDEVAALNALKTGQVDAANLTTKNIPEAESAGLSVHAGFGNTTWLEFLDYGELVPAFADVRVRQAMSMAFDRKAIGDSINFGYGYATSQLFPKGALEYVEGGDDRYAYDPERARELLAEAGYPDGFDLKFRVGASWGADYRPIVQSALGDIGIRVEYEIVPDADIVKLITEDWGSGEQPIAMATLAARGGNIGLWIPTSANNYGPDPRFKELVDAVMYGTPEELAPALTEMGPLLLDQVRHIPIGLAPTFYVSQPDVAVETYETARFAFLYQYTPVD
jgi:peptide/nickel transport system substrate-binding protein